MGGPNRPAQGGSGMNQRIRSLTVALSLLFLVLFVQATNWQYFRQEGLASDPRNNRVSAREFDDRRGPIVTADGTVVAATEPVSETVNPGSRFDWQRVYPQGDLFAHVTGYYTLDYGATQLERTQNAVLVGKDPAQQLAAVGGIFGGGDPTGSVHLTLRADLQRVAKQALGEREGSAVVVDVRTGAVLAMWSWPSFDPNPVVAHDGDDASAALAALHDDRRKPLLANAYQERYMPGSTFKVLTTAIGLERGGLTLDTVFPEERAWVPPDTTKPLRNYGGRACGGTLLEVFRRSCNIPFARTAVELGPALFVDGVDRFGFEQRIPFDLPASAASTFGGRPSRFDDALALLALHGFGGGDVQVTPLHMAMIAAAVGNGGRMMVPHVIAETRTNTGTVIYRARPETWLVPMRADTAALLTDLMVEVVRNGTASCCMTLKGGIQAAAKTGTAQLNPEGETERSHAWIMGFAPADAPRVAVAVMLRGVNDEISSSTGGRLAGPIAKRLLDAALSLVP